ncbi:MAG TPA: hypothetical protein VMV89_09375 [Candidatus Paceibacterota bacterium]|nr:hypothetical protein [Candidatus Paceibacterota bacterium]
MKFRMSCAGMFLVVLAICGCVHQPAPGVSINAAKLTPADLSTIRGANYRAAGAANTTDYWLHYNPAETERDLTYADRLKLNQLRVFVNYASWQTNQAAFRKKLIDLARACNRHHIGLMITVGDTQSFIGKDGAINRRQIRKFVLALVSAIGNEPALAFWDASNEPDYNAAGVPADRQQKRFEIARQIAATLHELDKKTPVTIGVAYETNMESLADAVDVLSFHDYLPTRAAISNDIARAKSFAAKSGKQVMDTETGCIARANPYDVTLEEHMKAHIGWYIWELMITKRWGNVHGVFYHDGTVRDPSIPAAMFGLFRNRTTNAILENVNREGWVNTDIQLAQAWLDNTNGTWNDGLEAAEKLANLLEAAQLIAMREPPSRTIELLRQGQPNPAALREQMTNYIALLKPFERPGASASSGVHPATMPVSLAPVVVYPIVRRANSRTPVDTADIRGANYEWNSSSTATVDRDLDYAQRLGINQLRVFFRPAQTNEALRQNLLYLVRAANQRGIGIMPVISCTPEMQGEGYPGAEAYAKFYVDTLSKEPGLAFWDVFNEPDYPPTPTNRVASRIAFARHMAGVFRKLDGHTPVTIGFAYEANMEKYPDDVDVLAFHDYLQTRQEVRTDIERARLAGEKAKKQVMDDEMCCVCRANPYDMAIQEHLNDHIGYYLFELMIASGRPRDWGDVHGIFYPDGTIRDPSIPMAVMGIFRNRGPDVVLEQPDREGRVTRTISDARNWLASANGDWRTGLDIAEIAANLLESAQLVPLHELPTRQVELLRRGPEDRAALKTLLEKDVATLQPYER